MGKIRVVLADDHQPMIASVRQTLGKEFEVVSASWSVVWRLAARCLLVLGILFCIVSRPATGAEPANGKKILVLNSTSIRGDNFDFLRSELRARIPPPVNLYVEYLEGRRLESQEYAEDLVGTLGHKYGKVKLDLVLIEYYPALQFVLKYRDELFPGVPIVFTMVEAGKIAGQKMWPGVTGVTAPVDFRATIDLALHLHPDTNTFALITGNSAYERDWLSLDHAELLRVHSRVKEVDLVGLPTSQFLERVAALPPRTIVLFELFSEESNQPAIGFNDVLAVVAHRLPTYCFPPILCMDHGGIGGVGFDGYKQLSLAAELARRVLSGERPETSRW